MIKSATSFYFSKTQLHKYFENVLFGNILTLNLSDMAKQSKVWTRCVVYLQKEFK